MNDNKVEVIKKAFTSFPFSIKHVLNILKNFHQFMDFKIS